MTNKEQKIIDMMIESYVTAYGVEKWRSLNEQEQHDVIMALCEISLRALNRI